MTSVQVVANVGAWTKLTGARRVESTEDRTAPIARMIAAAHARQESIQAVIGRPNVAIGQCLWLFCNVFPQQSDVASVARSGITRNRVERVLESIPSWVQGRFALSPLAAEANAKERAYGPVDVIYGDGAPVVWVVSASPVSEVQFSERRDALGTEATQLEGRGAGSRITAARIERQVELLDERAPAGLWNVEVWAGSSSPAEATSVLFGLSQMSGIADGPVTCGRNEPGWLGTTELASLMAVPDREVPGIRLIHRPAWDQVPEQSHASGDRIAIGAVLGEDDLATGVKFSVATETVNRHIFVSGATGSGKSESVRTLLTGLSERNIPWLAIEPAKAEYHALANRDGVGRLVVLRPGDFRFPAGGINPLEPTSVTVDGRTRHFGLQTHIDLIRTLFEASFEAQEPFPQVLSAALERSYRALDWDLHLGRPRRPDQRANPMYPTLGDLRRQALAVVDDAGYGPEVRDNVRGFIQVRLGGLDRGTPGRFFNTSHDLDLQDLATVPTVLQLENIGSDRDQAFVLGAFLIRWIEMLRLLGPQEDLKHVIAIEEAHRLLRDSGDPAKSHAIETLANLLAEVRSYGQGVIVAEQIPSKIIPDVVKNSALKILHRLPAEDDRSFVGATMNLDDGQGRAVVGFRPGEAAVHGDGMDHPIRVQVYLGTESRSSGTEPPRMTVRSPVCQRQCGSTPCGVAQLSTAQRLMDSWELEAWIDIVVLAHLAGRNLPGLGDTHLNTALDLVDRDPERLACGIAHLVQRSVKARWLDVVPYMDPDDLILAVTEASSRYLQTAQWEQGRAQVRWQVRNCRWIHIEEALMLAMSDAGPDDPHPQTQTWQSEYPDLDLPASPVADQLEHVRTRHAAENRDLWSLVWGQPSIVRQSISTKTDLAAIGLEEHWVAQILFDRWNPSSRHELDGQ